MDELARIHQDFMRGQELILRAYLDLLTLKHPPATGLFPVFGAPVPKPPEGAP